MRLLGLDWGTSKVGIAISDPLGITAQPLHYLKNDATLMNAISSLIDKNSVEAIILGFPKNMNGSEGDSADHVKEFRDKLAGGLGIEVKLWDERLTTKTAMRTLIDSDVSRKKRKQIIDSASACVMLQGYMDSIRK